MEVKSHQLLYTAFVVLAVGFVLGIATGSAFPMRVVVEPVSVYSSVTVEEQFNFFAMFAVWCSSACIAVALWFFSTVLFYLEKNRNFNKRAIILLETIVQQTASQQPAEISAPEQR